MKMYLIGGQWLDGIDAVEARNPADMSGVVGQFVRVSEEQVDDDANAARAALPTWANVIPQRRSDLPESA